MKLVIFVIPILLILNSLTFGQERFLMDQNTFQKFKQAKRLYVKGEQLFLKGKLSKAQQSLEKCVEVFPKYSEAYFILAQVLYKQKELVTALDQISNAKTHFKYMSDIRVSTQLEYIDTLREQRQKVQEQLRALKEQLATTKNASQKSRIESAIATTEGQLSQLDNRLHSPIPNIEGLPAEYYYVHGNIFFKMKRFQDAHKQYLETIKVDPNHGKALSNLSSLYFMGKKYAKAKQYLDRAEAAGVTANEKFKDAILKALEK